MLSNNILSEKLQKDILNALSIFHPQPMPVGQYLDCFGDYDEFQMIANVEALISKGLIHENAIHRHDGQGFLSLSQLKFVNPPVNSLSQA